MLRPEPKYGKAPINDDAFLSISEVAVLLNTSKSSVNALFNKTDCPAKRIPKVGWRVRKSDLFQYVDNLNKNEY